MFIRNQISIILLDQSMNLSQSLNPDDGNKPPRLIDQTEPQFTGVIHLSFTRDS